MLVVVETVVVGLMVVDFVVRSVVARFAINIGPEA